MNLSFDENRWLLLVGFGLAWLALLYVALARPWLLTDVRYLGAMIGAEITLAALWHYEEIFFTLVIGVFLWSTLDLPLQVQVMTGRWAVLGAAAWMGLLLWFRGKRRHRFSLFHLIAATFLCVAVVSVLVSGAPRSSFEKVSSLVLLFIYAATGVRIGLEGKESAVVKWLTWSCEVLTLIVAPLTLIFHKDPFGHPNAVGAAFGAVVIPVLLCNLLAWERLDKAVLHRRVVLLLLASGVLYQSRARAAILAVGLTTILVCLVLRKQVFLLRTGLVAVFLLSLAGVANPQQFEAFANSVTSEMIFKGKSADYGVWISRVGPWERTVTSIKQHPWFGTGFGTSDISRDVLSGNSTARQLGTNREHGNSYLAIAEYVGLVGCIPFGFLLLLLILRLVRIYQWLRRTTNVTHPYVTISAVLSACLIHAFFEDWLVAVGSYLCVFFWSLAFVTMDFNPIANSRSQVSRVDFASWPGALALRPPQATSSGSSGYRSMHPF